MVYTNPRLSLLRNCFLVFLEGDVTQRSPPGLLRDIPKNGWEETDHQMGSIYVIP